MRKIDAGAKQALYPTAAHFHAAIGLESHFNTGRGQTAFLLVHCLGFRRDQAPELLTLGS